MQKLLITGVDTPLGANLALALSDRWQVVPLGSASFAAVIPTCDLCDPRELELRLAQESPDWVIHCGDWSRGIWDCDAIETEPGHAAHTARTLAGACRSANVRLCVITGDGQFAGPRMFHAEDAPSTAEGAVPETIRSVEQAVQGSANLIVRTHAYGWSPWPDQPCFAQRVWQALGDGRDCPVDDDRYATPILATDLADQLHEALTQQWHGTYHISGIERTNQRRFAAELAVAFGFTGRVVPLVAPDRPVGRRLVDETSLNTGLARRRLTAPLPMLREGLLRFAYQTEGDWRDQLDGLVHGEYLQQRAA